MTAVRDRLRDPVVWGNAFLLVKAAGAAVLAWVLARSVLGLAQPFLAPWAALLTVHATVYRTRELDKDNLRNILMAMDTVAEAQPVRVEARPAAALSGRRRSIA